MIIRKINFLLVLLLVCVKSFAQEKEIVEQLRHYQLDSVLHLLQDKDFPNLRWQYNFLMQFDSNKAEISIDTINTYPIKNKIEQFYSFINKGDIYFYRYFDKNIESLQEYNLALELAEAEKDSLLINEALKKILTIHRLDILYDNVTYKTYLDKYLLTANNSLEIAYYHYFNLILNFKNYKVEKWDVDSYNHLNFFFKSNITPFLKGITYTVYASYYEEIKQKDSIWYYINKAEESLLTIKENYPKSRLRQLYSFTSRIAVNEQNTKRASEALSKVENKHYNKIDFKIEAQKLYYQAVIDTINGDYRSAFNNYIKSNVIIDTLEMNNYKNLLNEFEVKYQTQKKDKQILIQQTKIIEGQRQKRNLWIGGITILFFGSIFGFLLYKNTKRKQQIAEQEREIEIQKKEKILKDQELTTIDAMIEGQEKERQRLASDLHDSVGATLSAARLQFEHLCKHKGTGSLKNEEELFDKTGNLLEEAYQEIRSMAHLKNSGVIATKGLLPAVQKLARNASNTNGLQIYVEDFGLTQKIEGSLEISIFRVIQELVTNIIKHAQATEATISITQHDDMLSIIIEDNGKGFDVRKSKSKNGMGLSSIEKRIEHLEGNFEVDSTPEKGTNILIDIPI